MIRNSGTGRYILLALVMALAASHASGDDAAPGTRDLTLPAGFFTGRPLLDSDLEEKEEGWSPVILPLFNYRTGKGLGIGFMGGVDYNGSRKDPFFAFAPYAGEMTAQVFRTSRGEEDYSLRGDFPYIFGSFLEIIAEAGYSRDPGAKYFGIGPGAAERSLAEGPASSLYEYRYLTRSGSLWGLVSVLRDFKIMAGYSYKYASAASPSGSRSVPAFIDTDPDAAGTKRSGLHSSARFGAGFDTRDYAPDPRRGIYLDYTAALTSRSLGADFNYTRHTAGARFYATPGLGITVAVRVAYTTVSGGVPFYEMGTFLFLTEEQTGLGNDTTLRGFEPNRFIGRTMTLGNLEVRWEAVRFRLFGRSFALKIIGFTDAGSVFRAAGDPLRSMEGYHAGYGGGLAVAYNHSTIIRFYAGFSKEDRTVSLDFNHAF